MKKIFIVSLILLGFQSLFAQETFTRKDSLRGSLQYGKGNYNVLRYDLNIKVNVEEKSISGYNDITFKATVNKTKDIQIDLFENMVIDSIIHNNEKIPFTREFNAVFLTFPQFLVQKFEKKIRVYYSGKPTIAKRAPWDGGFVFSKDKQGKPWIGVACQGDGASLWFPCKDSQTDEPDNGVSIKVTVPNGLMNVSNGRLLGSEDLKNGYTRWDWEVKNPINNYNITVNIADYAHIHDTHNGLDLDYYVLKENEEKAKTHFEEVKPMLDCFESKFGKYPFAEDGYKLVETPYLGMEHQSAVAYGNGYKKGYQGTDLSDTGIGLLFDFIIVHESGHEWFGNSITSKDVADMWIHEGFTCYSESVFVECQYGYEKAQTYINGLKRNVLNDKPIMGQFDVANEGSGDMYYKGALMLNTIRHILNDDAKWWKLLLSYSEKFRHKIIDNRMVLAYFERETGLNLKPVFNQYLKYKNIPVLELKITNKLLEYRWKTDEPNFAMPIDIKIKGKETRLQPTNEWQKSTFKVKKMKEVEVLTNEFFVDIER
ncbi:M1 family metallopeptidase [Flavobacterium sp.]|jgi:aminopeptidase N|uniref:M1 family metallopeptidase n=1 Tax=Flavobacterium sp. TaxID=239 RepID=UPI0037BF7D37